MSEFERRPRSISSAPRLQPEEISGRSFPSAFRGLADGEVRNFLRRVADDVAAGRAREAELEERIEELTEELRQPPELTEQQLLDAFGEETARVLRSARAAAEDMRTKAEARAAQLIAEAQEQSSARREEAERLADEQTREARERAEGTVAEAEARAESIRADSDRRAVEQRERVEAQAEALLAEAKAEGRDVVEEAQAVRDRVLADLARRRELLGAQIEALRNGRDHLLDAYRVVKRTFLEATASLTEVEARMASGEPAVPPEEPEGPEGVLDATAASAPAEEPGGEEAAAAGATAAEPVPPEGDALDEVDSLFARLRAARAEPVPEGEAEAPPGAGAGPSEPGPAAPGALGEEGAIADDGEGTAALDEDDEGSEAADEDGADAGDDADGGEEAAPGDGPGAALLAARDEALAPLQRPLVRAAKRTAQDEQNAVLDAVRRHKRGRAASADVVASPEDTIATWADVLAEPVGRAYTAGYAAYAGSEAESAAAPGDLVAELAEQVARPLRERVVAAVDEAEDLEDDAETEALVVERIGARYREWKTEQLEGLLGGALATAYSRGVYDAAPEGAVLVWLPPADGCSADCGDNALEPTVKGEAFPTGHTRPPAHPRCRCLLAAAAALGP